MKARLALVRREFDYIKHFAKVVHLYQAYEVQPDFASRDRLLDAIDARNAEIATYYGERGRAVCRCLETGPGSCFRPEATRMPTCDWPTTTIRNPTKTLVSIGTLKRCDPRLCPVSSA